MRTMLAAVIASVGASNALAGTIDLDAPGAMSALAARNPAHHATSVRLIAVAQRTDCFGRDLQAARVALGVAHLDCTLLVRTSDPPKRSLTFALDGTVYRSHVVLDMRPTLQHAR